VNLAKTEWKIPAITPAAFVVLVLLASTPQNTGSGAQGKPVFKGEGFLSACFFLQAFEAWPRLSACHARKPFNPAAI
jgi:hypothetical protein